MTENIHYLVPGNLLGAEKDLSYSITADNVDDACDLFIIAKDRLLDVNNWGKHMAVAFSLTDTHSHPVHRHAHKGDKIRSESGSAVISAIEYDDYPDENRESFAMHLAQDEHPESASVTLVVERSGRQLASYCHLRNHAAAPAAWNGITHAQWSALVKYFIGYSN